jgi:hypothetical protein
MPLPLIPIGIAAGVGLIAGLLGRQPEVNRLKRQVQLLQEEIERLSLIIEEQNRQIGELKLRFSALKGYAFVEKMKTECDVRGIILHQCAYREWMELTFSQAHEKVATQEELRFYNLYEALLRGAEVDKRQVAEIRDYIYKRYEYELKQMKAPDMEKTLAMIGEANAA